MTTKYVKYCSYWKAPCAKVTDAPVVLCLQDAALVVQFDPPCGLPLTTILATICQAYTLNDGCGNALWNYTFAYDDEQLVSPDSPLIAGDITGFFCQDCLTDWVQQQISCVETSGGSGSVIPYYSNVCAGLVTALDGEGYAITKDISFDSTLFASCGQRIDFKVVGTWNTVNPDIAYVEISFGGEALGFLTFDTDTAGNWFIEGYVSRGVFNDTEWVCFGYNIDMKTNDNDDLTVDHPAFGNRSIALPFPATLEFEVYASVGSVDSSMTVDQIILDYYDVPVTCEEGDNPTACCD